MKCEVRVKWWGFHKLFNTRKYRLCKFVEWYLNASEFEKDFKKQLCDNLLFGIPIIMKHGDTFQIYLGGSY